MYGGGVELVTVTGDGDNHSLTRVVTLSNRDIVSRL